MQILKLDLKNFTVYDFWFFLLHNSVFNSLVKLHYPIISDDSNVQWNNFDVDASVGTLGKVLNGPVIDTLKGHFLNLTINSYKVVW